MKKKTENEELSPTAPAYEQMELIILPQDTQNTQNTQNTLPLPPLFPGPLVDSTAAKEIVAELHSRQPVPDEVAKSRSLLMDDMVHKPIQSPLKISQEEKSPLATGYIKTKALVSLALDNQDIMLKTSDTLTPFDREVIDAVATLITHIDVMSAATIYRTISGKQANQFVTPAQQQRVEESLRRCSRCTVAIDATASFLQAIPQQKGKTKRLSFRGPLIAYSEIIHESQSETNTFFQILQIPPIFKYAETIGKVSHFPFELLDTPVHKTESLIFIQGYLLRTIDEMNKGILVSREILWEKLYQISECDLSKRQYKEKLRKKTIKMLEYWVEKEFIADFTNVLTGVEKKIIIQLIESV